MKQTVLVKKGLSGYSCESVENYIKELDAACAANEERLNDKIASLEDALSKANAEKDSLHRIIDDKTKEHEALYAQFNELKAESRCLNDQVSLMHTKNYKLELENEKIREQIAKIPAISDELDKFLAAVRDELAKTAETLSVHAEAFRDEIIVKGAGSDEE